MSANGPGIAADLLPQVFEPNYMTKVSHSGSESDGPGNGLRLHYCREVVKSYGGSLELKSEAGDGGVVATLRPPWSAAHVMRAADGCRRVKRSLRAGPCGGKFD